MRKCPNCGYEIYEDEPVEEVGSQTYHAGCWQEKEEEMENAELEDL